MCVCDTKYICDRFTNILAISYLIYSCLSIRNKLVIYKQDQVKKGITVALAHYLNKEETREIYPNKVQQERKGAIMQF